MRLGEAGRRFLRIQNDNAAPLRKEKSGRRVDRAVFGEDAEGIVAGRGDEENEVDYRIVGYTGCCEKA